MKKIDLKRMFTLQIVMFTKAIAQTNNPLVRIGKFSSAYITIKNNLTRLKQTMVFGSLLIIQSSIAAEGINGEATVNQYNDFYQSWSYPQILENFVGGGGGSMSINITNDLLTVIFNAGFSENKLKNGFVVSFATSPALPNMELGFLNLKNGTTLYNNNVKVSITSNAIIFEHLAGHNNQLYTYVNSTFQVDLTTLGSGGNIGETPSAAQNYIMATIYQKGYTEAQIGNATDSEKISSVQYFDGLGRPNQSVAIRAGGANQDIITHIAYDDFGRQAKDYLPYAAASNGGAIRTDALSATNSFYLTDKYENTINPNSEKLFEASPLNRVMQQAVPGASWKLGTGHEIKFDYQTNIAGEVKLYTATAIWNTTSGLYNTGLVNGAGTVFYGAGQLHKTVTYDENTAAVPTETNGSTVEFKNKQGQVVLKRTYNAGIKHDTYYMYDDFGNLTYVMPPKADASITTAILDELCYQYKYDSRNRLVEKKIPGKQWEFIVYDKLDRPIATGPALSPFTSPTGNGWLITKYDTFDRPVITAWMPATVTSAGRKTLQDAIDAELTNFSETKIATTANTTINGVAFRYTNVVFPTSGYHVLTVNYFDDYNFPNAPTIPSAIELQTVYYNTTVKPKGLATGTWTRVLETSTLYKNEIAYTLYDYKARPIRSYSQNYLGGYTYVDSKLDFTGKPEYTVTKHKLLGSSVELTTREDFVYSDQGRLLTQTHQINTGAKQLIAKNDYDELGQLIGKKVGGTDITGAVGLQTIDYAYNIRGWLKQINDPNILGTDLFGFKINYNTASHGATPLYNGNISETEWKTQNDNVLRWYNYGYDALNRITKGISSDGKFDLGSTTNPVTYDQNGNILSLYRKGAIVTNPVIGTSANYGVMDQLTYTYQANSNKLTIVSDAGNDTFGFKDDQIGNGTDITVDYTYDANGNMLKDLNKAMTSNILYNHLNLPTKVTFASGNISYIYDAKGVKLEKVVTEGTAITRTKYVGNFIYEKIGTAADALKFFSTAEGYVEPNGGTGYNYVYQYKDHLGNIRLSYKDISLTSTPSLQIVEENNYYPFGLKHKGYNSNVSAGVNSIAKKFKFNGKEFEEGLGLNLYEMDVRSYDPAIGRWTSVDPVTHYSMSTYNSFDNNPVFWSDPSGADGAQNIIGGAGWSGVFFDSFEAVQSSFGGNNSGADTAQDDDSKVDQNTVYLDEVLIIANNRDSFNKAIDNIIAQIYSTDYYAQGGGGGILTGTEKHFNGGLGTVGVAVQGYNNIPNDVKRAYAYKLSKMTGVKSGQIFQGAKSFANSTGKVVSKLGPVGTVLGGGVITYEVMSGTWDAHTAVNGGLMIGAGVATFFAAPAVLTGIAIYGVGDYFFDFGGTIDKTVGRNSGVWEP